MTDTANKDEYLISVAFDVDKESESKFKSATQMAGKSVANVATAASGIAVAVGAAVLKASSDLSKFHMEAARAGTSDAKIRALGFAFSQIGGNAGQAMQSVSALRTKLRDLPGVASQMKRVLNVDAYDKATGKLRDHVDILRDMGKAFQNMSSARATLAGAQFGLDADTVDLMRSGKLEEQFERALRHQKAMGVDLDANAKKAAQFMGDMDSMFEDVKVFATAVLTDLVGGQLSEMAEKLPSVLGEWRVAIKDFTTEVGKAWDALVARFQEAVELVTGVYDKVTGAYNAVTGKVNAVTDSVATKGVWDTAKDWWDDKGAFEKKPEPAPEPTKQKPQPVPTIAPSRDPIEFVLKVPEKRTEAKPEKSTFAPLDAVRGKEPQRDVFGSISKAQREKDARAQKPAEVTEKRVTGNVPKPQEPPVTTAETKPQAQAKASESVVKHDVNANVSVDVPSMPTLKVDVPAIDAPKIGNVGVDAPKSIGLDVPAIDAPKIAPIEVEKPETVGVKHTFDPFDLKSPLAIPRRDKQEQALTVPKPTTATPNAQTAEEAKDAKRSPEAVGLATPQVVTTPEGETSVSNVTNSTSNVTNLTNTNKNVNITQNITVNGGRDLARSTGDAVRGATQDGLRTFGSALR